MVASCLWELWSGRKEMDGIAEATKSSFSAPAIPIRYCQKSDFGRITDRTAGLDSDRILGGKGAVL